MGGPDVQEPERGESPPLESVSYHGSTRFRDRVAGLYAHPWTQIILISLICFCCPGMFNALTGLGGSGQVNSQVTANGQVALASTTAVFALFFAGPLFSLLGPKITFLLGGWTYALYSGSLLNFRNHQTETGNGTFIIVASAILGIGASLLWVVQGAIMTTYVDESQKGRAIAVFWIIFNLGGGLGSLASFGINYHSTSAEVSSSTYVALMAVMLVGWVLGVFICAPRRIRLAQLRAASATNEESLPLRIVFRRTLNTLYKTLFTWRVACMIPLFFSANVFYSYQQNNVNGGTFNIRTRSLNGALYWIAQMFGGLLIGVLLDLPSLSRPQRARLGWAFVLVTGMAIWGGGLAFQRWEDKRIAQGLVQDIDYKQGSISTGPMILYICYGAYDALWQGFAYWMIGTESNAADRAAVLVGAYKGFQAAGGAMAWRVNAVGTSPLTQLGMDWGLCIGSLVIIAPAVWTVSRTTTAEADNIDGRLERTYEEKGGEIQSD